MRLCKKWLSLLVLVAIFGSTQGALGQEKKIPKGKKAKYPLLQIRVGAPKFELEQRSIRSLRRTNPKYFGKLPILRLRPKSIKKNNTKYEELRCVGFFPQRDELQATVDIKLPKGYGGNLCKTGTWEFVRFYLNYGSGWEDVGVTAFKAHDIPTSRDCEKKQNKPLSYTARLEVPTWKRFCNTPVLPRVRAILSWNEIPLPNEPNWRPEYGNVLESSIQTQPLSLPFPPKLLKKMLIKQPELKAKIQIKTPLRLRNLAKMYRGKVEAHRFGANEIHKAMVKGKVPKGVMAKKLAQWKGLGLNWPKAVKDLQKTQANTNFEELVCLGLEHTGYQERLVATLRIKRPVGYSGDLCHRGSLEHVAFWADWDDKCRWTYLGTVSVRVHDFPKLPRGGLCYTAVLPVDLTKYRRSCKIPRIGRVRAVLSWSVPASTTNPNALNYFGNRLDRHVQIKPTESSIETTRLIGVIGGIPVSQINDKTGLTTPDALFALTGLPADNHARPCPFGRRVVIQGRTFPGLLYRVRVKKVGDPATSWSTVTTRLRLTDVDGNVRFHSPATPDGYFKYVKPEENVNSILAWWDTAGDDLWEVKLEVKGKSKFDVHRVQLDNTGPDTAIYIANGGDCKTFKVGANIKGEFLARDHFFGEYHLYTLPFRSPKNQLKPEFGTAQTGSSGATWTLKTAGMRECGYVLRVWARDRSILNSGPGNHRKSSSAVGFCLRK